MRKLLVCLIAILSFFSSVSCNENQIILKNVICRINPDTMKEIEPPINMEILKIGKSRNVIYRTYKFPHTATDVVSHLEIFKNFEKTIKEIKNVFSYSIVEFPNFKPYLSFEMNGIKYEISDITISNYTPGSVYHIRVSEKSKVTVFKLSVEHQLTDDIFNINKIIYNKIKMEQHKKQ